MALSRPQPTQSTHSQLPELSPPQHISSPSPNPSQPSVEPKSPRSSATDVFAAAPSTSTRHSNISKHYSSSPSKQPRSGLFSLAALARDKTTSAIANFSEPSIRSQRSSSSLYLSAQSSPTTSTLTLNTAHSPTSIDSLIAPSTEPLLYEPQLTIKPAHHRFSHTRSDTINSTASRSSLLETDPPSQAYSDTAANTTPPVLQAPLGHYNKMHQTSSRLLRMTTDDRPFTRVGYQINIHGLY